MKATAATKMPTIAFGDRLFPLLVDEDGLVIVVAPVFVDTELLVVDILVVNVLVVDVLLVDVLLVDVIYRQTCSTLAVIESVSKIVYSEKLYLDIF
jgi:hypothetical protein